VNPRAPRRHFFFDFDEDFFDVDFFDEDFFAAVFFEDDFFAGTFPPFSLASESPMAIACLRLVTFLPELLFSVPFFFRCIALSTRLLEAFPYFEAIA
jgi:hypothetical protein